jgi:hypothetical protein
MRWCWPGGCCRGHNDDHIYFGVHSPAVRSPYNGWIGCAAGRRGGGVAPPPHRNKLKSGGSRVALVIKTFSISTCLQVNRTQNVSYSTISLESHITATTFKCIVSVKFTNHALYTNLFSMKTVSPNDIFR